MHVKVFDMRELLLIHLGVIILWVWVGCFFLSSESLPLRKTTVEPRWLCTLGFVILYFCICLHFSIKFKETFLKLRPL